MGIVLVEKCQPHNQRRLKHSSGACTQQCYTYSMYVVYKQLASYNIIATLHKHSQCSTKRLCSVGDTSLLLHTLKKAAAISVRVEHTAVGWGFTCSCTA